MWNLLTRLLDIDQIRDAEPGSITLRWQNPWANWVLLLTVVLALVFVALTYDRERVRPRLRLALAALRTLLVLMIVALLCRPVLVWERSHEEPSITAVLIDTSASMARADLYSDVREEKAARFAAARVTSPTTTPSTRESPPAFGPTLPSRFELLHAALEASVNEPGVLSGCLSTNQVELHTFGTRLTHVAAAASEQQLDEALDILWQCRPQEQTTDVAGALEEAMTTPRTGRLSALVVASDGQATTPSDYRRIVDMAKRRRVPIIPLLTGSSAPTVDVAVGPLLADETVFVKDIVAIRGTLRAVLPEEQPLQIDLFERSRTDPVASQSVNLGGENRRGEFEFRVRPFRAGLHSYRVTARSLPNEIDLANNVSHVEIRAIEDKTRVLYVEAYPRFEYRYLKNTLVREPTIVSSVLLLSADEGFSQEGTAPVLRFPEAEDELSSYDVVILGDVDPRSGATGAAGWLTPQQAELLVRFVGQRGGGFILLAGQRSAPQAFRGTPLEKLLPVMIDPQYSGLPSSWQNADATTITAGYQLELTPEGHESPIFRFEKEPEENLETIASLPALFWHAPTLGPKPAAEVLARHPIDRTVSGPAPIVVTGRYGAGRVLFHGTDDTWRWRRGAGEAYYDTYWLQAIRYCTENRLLAQTRAARLFTDRSRYQYGEPVEVTLRLASSDLAESLAEEVLAQYRSLDLRHAGDLTLSRLGPEARLFEGRFSPPAEGSYVLSVDLGLLAGQPVIPEVNIQVQATSLESLRREADHVTLRQLAAQTGGQALYLDELGRLAGLLPDRRVEIPDDVAEPLWDMRLVLGLMVLVLTVEWSLRKWFGLI
ncbi:MAG: hypothetical protein JSU68_00265 [Phycisphaerales bacterium]|nr:MAG: hypothetical protein JSU68_00265 [Phycisphaerales bacterium]